MDIKNTILKNFGINRLTVSSLKEAVAGCNAELSDNKKRYITREIALSVIGNLKTAGRNNKKKGAAYVPPPLTDTKVLAVNHAGPLDVAIDWRSGPDGVLNFSDCRVDAGGDQINVSKVFGNFNENIALVALAGKEGGEITGEWERKFLSKSMNSFLIRDTREDGQIALYNTIDGNILPGIFGWKDELSKETVKSINDKAVSTLDEMLKGSADNVWMVLSAGGPVRYNRSLACYASLINRVKDRYGGKVKLLIDFKFMSGPEEAMSVLDIPRKSPQDIIKPNLEEFIQLLVSSGLAEKSRLDKNSLTEEDIKEYAIRLRKKYNFMGVLVSLDKAGLMLVMPDRVIREKGIKIELACHTAAGDSLKAGFVYALSRGMSIEEAVHTGNLFGASTASMRGSLTVNPERLAEVENLARVQNVTPKTEYLA
ncbi:MAG: PfkB family carbohydrate kinase [Candidatus Omnitrophota bacterium]